MEYSEYINNLGSFPSKEPSLYCKICGCEVENEDDLKRINHKDYGYIDVCLDCLNEIWEEKKNEEQ